MIPCGKGDVLIVPFMELKPVLLTVVVTSLPCLNRTFYGIETCTSMSRSWRYTHVLIVPFMELKPASVSTMSLLVECLNRTFYGIETVVSVWSVVRSLVLIVPFMELKRRWQRAERGLHLS